MADEYYSFEEALDELRLKEEELKRLVSEGEIRAFREGETMKLRQSDVQALRDELSGGEVVDLGGVEEELVFEDEDLGEAGMATEEISTADTIIDDDVEDVGEIDLEDDDDEIETAAPVRRAAPRAAATVEEDEGSEKGLLRDLLEIHVQGQHDRAAGAGSLDPPSARRGSPRRRCPAPRLRVRACRSEPRRTPARCRPAPRRRRPRRALRAPGRRAGGSAAGCARRTHRARCRADP